MAFDPNKDYSKAIEEAKRAGQDTTQLQKERQEKINSVYGGNEPLYAGTGMTYSQYSSQQNKPAATTSGGSSSRSSGSSSAVTAPAATTSQSPTGVYAIGSLYGIQQIDNLTNQAKASGTAATWNNPDGSVWTVGANGDITVKNKYGEILRGQTHEEGLSDSDRASLNYTRSLVSAYDESQRNNAEILSQIDDLRTQMLNANNAATEINIKDLEAQLAESLPKYDALRAQNAYSAAQAADNLALQRTANGELGGIGNKQYSDQMASYDQQLYQIQLEQINLTNQINSDIEKLEAENRYNEANILYEWGQMKINALQDQADKLAEMKMTTASNLYKAQQDAAAVAYDRAMNNLQLGIFSAGDAKALGIPESEAQRVAQYYNTLAQIDLAQAKASLRKLQKSNEDYNGTQTKSVFGGMSQLALNTLSYALEGSPVSDANGNTFTTTDGAITVYHRNGTSGKLYLTGEGDLYLTDANGFVDGDTIKGADGTYVYSESNGMFVPVSDSRPATR